MPELRLDRAEMPVIAGVGRFCPAALALGQNWASEWTNWTKLVFAPVNKKPGKYLKPENKLNLSVFSAYGYMHPVG